MSEIEIDEIIFMVRQTAMSRYSWLSQLREPTVDEFAKAQLFCEMYPTKEQEIDRAVTVKLVING